nr:hypothetical protein CFP56_32943 [Quercus suber]
MLPKLNYSFRRKIRASSAPLSTEDYEEGNAEFGNDVPVEAPGTEPIVPPIDEAPLSEAPAAPLEVVALETLAKEKPTGAPMMRHKRVARKQVVSKPKRKGPVTISIDFSPEGSLEEDQSHISSGEAAHTRSSAEALIVLSPDDVPPVAEQGVDEERPEKHPASSLASQARDSKGKGVADTRSPAPAGKHSHVEPKSEVPSKVTMARS